MNPLTLKELSGNAFRMLGLTVDATQAQIDASARRMRIWQDPAQVPGSVNDAAWMGPIPRTRQNIENAVARLADPLSRLEERFWWFCLTPPDSDAPPATDPTTIPAFHDFALIHVYRSLLTDTASENPRAWRGLIECFKTLATSDDYLQWLFDVESAGNFEKAATLEEIAEAQQRLPLRLGTAIAGSANEALAGGDFAAATQAARLVGADSPGVAEELFDRMEDELAGRCNELVAKIDAAWKTRQVAELRPACNHAIARFGTIIRPLIDQLASATHDVDRQHRARMHGVKLLIHTAEAYEAFDNFLASQRALETALALGANTLMEPEVVFRLDKVKDAARRQRAGVPRGHRQQPAAGKEFKMKSGGPMRGESWLSAVPLRVLLWLFVALGTGVARIGCGYAENSRSAAPGSTPHYDATHQPQFGAP